jgi:hypothetical protein
MYGKGETGINIMANRHSIRDSVHNTRCRVVQLLTVNTFSMM